MKKHRPGQKPAIGNHSNWANITCPTSCRVSGQGNSPGFEIKYGVYMLTIKPELERTLKQLAQQEQVSLDEVIKRLISHYAKQKQPPGLLGSMAKDLPEPPVSAGQEPSGTPIKMHGETTTAKQQDLAKQELGSLMVKIPRTVSLVDELIQDRRLEAKRE
jgi:hypothetical protein